MGWGASDVPPQEREPDPEPAPPPPPPREPVILVERTTSSRLPDPELEPVPVARVRPINSNGGHRFPKAFKTPEDEQRLAEAQARRERRQKRNLERA
jgi:hypothetical protein